MVDRTNADQNQFALGEPLPRTIPLDEESGTIYQPDLSKGLAPTPDAMLEQLEQPKRPGGRFASIIQAIVLRRRRASRSDGTVARYRVIPHCRAHSVATGEVDSADPSGSILRASLSKFVLARASRHADDQESAARLPRLEIGRVLCLSGFVGVGCVAFHFLSDLFDHLPTAAAAFSHAERGLF